MADELTTPAQSLHGASGEKVFIYGFVQLDVENPSKSVCIVPEEPNTISGKGWLSRRRFLDLSETPGAEALRGFIEPHIVPPSQEFELSGMHPTLHFAAVASMGEDGSIQSISSPVQVADFPVNRVYKLIDKNSDGFTLGPPNGSSELSGLAPEDQLRISRKAVNACWLDDVQLGAKVGIEYLHADGKIVALLQMRTTLRDERLSPHETRIRLLEQQIRAGTAALICGDDPWDDGQEPSERALETVQKILGYRRAIEILRKQQDPTYDPATAATIVTGGGRFTANPTSTATRRILEERGTEDVPSPPER